MPVSRSTTEFTDDDRNFLIGLAKKAIANYPEKLDPKDVPAKLKEKRGAFVSVYVKDSLRGCIGYLEGILPLYHAVIENAAAAAYQDDRFYHIKKSELNDLSVEISVLSVPQRLDYKGGDGLQSKLNCKEGVIIKLGYRNATFLPQVWKELPDKTQFLSHLCMKAGLPRNEWENGELEVFTYYAEVFRG